MGIAFSDYLPHDFFPLFIVTLWMCLRQINVLSLSLSLSQSIIFFLTAVAMMSSLKIAALEPWLRARAVARARCNQ